MASEWETGTRDIEGRNIVEASHPQGMKQLHPLNAALKSMSGLTYLTFLCYFLLRHKKSSGQGPYHLLDPLFIYIFKKKVHSGGVTHPHTEWCRGQAARLNAAPAWIY